MLSDCEKWMGGKWQEPGDTQQVTDKILTVCFLPLHACSSSLQSYSLPYCAGLLDGRAQDATKPEKSAKWCGLNLSALLPARTFCFSVLKSWSEKCIFCSFTLSDVRNIWVIKKFWNLNVFHILNASLFSLRAWLKFVGYFLKSCHYRSLLPFR